MLEKINRECLSKESGVEMRECVKSLKKVRTDFRS